MDKFEGEEETFLPVPMWRLNIQVCDISYYNLPFETRVLKGISVLSMISYVFINYSKHYQFLSVFFQMVCITGHILKKKKLLGQDQFRWINFIPCMTRSMGKTVPLHYLKTDLPTYSKKYIFKSLLTSKLIWNVIEKLIIPLLTLKIYLRQTPSINFVTSSFFRAARLI